MRELAKIIILLLIFCNSIMSQVDSSQPYDMKGGESTLSDEKQSDNYFGFQASERVITTAVIISEIIILFFVLFYWRNTRNDSKNKVTNTYRKNIQAIRDERILPNLNRKKTIERKALLTRNISKVINRNTITSRAKKLSVAKGELFLAARIQQLQIQNQNK